MDHDMVERERVVRTLHDLVQQVDELLADHVVGVDITSVNMRINTYRTDSATIGLIFSPGYTATLRVELATARSKAGYDA